MNDLSKACLDEAKNNMQGAIKHLEAELTKVRAGKANPAMLDGIKVDYYGTPTLISQIANISTPEECSTEGYSQTACGFVIEFADIITEYHMNEYSDDYPDGTNVGGWEASEMRRLGQELNTEITSAYSEVRTPPSITDFATTVLSPQLIYTAIS